ncbi:MAG TPA: chromate efflux transporter [Gemmatimonadaceae bacterium]
MESAASEPLIPRQSLGGLLLRFLRFGCLAWGGPVAQIAMIRQELVENERWISPARFNRVLAVYQALPGPEAHELCVYFGMLARGRWGAVVAGIGFMLPGFVLMFGISWWYLTHGIDAQRFAGAFHAMQAAVAALIVRAVFRLGSHAVTTRWLLAIALAGAAAQLLGVHFLVTLLAAGLIHSAARGRIAPRSAVLMALPLNAGPALAALAVPGLLSLFVVGLRSGLLTFGGAYTVIPFLQHDAVVIGGWMTNEQFLDGLALSSILPAPAVIIATFVGYAGGGPVGAIALTAGVFLPAFAFTLIGHRRFERVTDDRTVHAFLDGITAAVIGLIAVTAAGLSRVAVTDLPSAVVFSAVLVLLSVWRSSAAAPVVMLGSALVGSIL